ncbi:MAG: serine/threonine-protein kinase [Marmoricola sp.]
MTVIASRYRLDHEIGRGGMGTVWLAQDTVLGRSVALKQIGVLPGTSEADLDRVRREAQVSARLSHEHVVVVFDLVTEADQHWLVMEYVESETLAHLVQHRGALPVDEVAALALQAADALSAAHRAGIVHRDVKPSNLLVSPSGHVKLGDFGIARVEADQSLTQTGLLVGSPGYLAPEVALGGAATGSSDMWSLGATLFCAVEGHPAYDSSENVIGTLYRVVNEEPPWPEHAGWLAPMVHDLMDRDPERRWDADAVKDFLEAGPDAVDRTQMLSAPPVAVPVMRDAPPRRRARLPRAVLPVAGVLAVLLLLVGAVVVARNMGGPDRATAGGTPSSPASSPSPKTSSDKPAADSGPTAAAMKRFVTDYLATAPTDPQRSFAELTPSYQERSGGFAGYEGYWGTVASAKPTSLRAYPDDLTVSFLAKYQLKSGAPRTDGVTLHLVYDGTKYLIDGDDSRRVSS